VAQRGSLVVMAATVPAKKPSVLKRQRVTETRRVYNKVRVLVSWRASISPATPETGHRGVWRAIKARGCGPGQARNRWAGPRSATGPDMWTSCGHPGDTAGNCAIMRPLLRPMYPPLAGRDPRGSCPPARRHPPTSPPAPWPPTSQDRKSAVATRIKKVLAACAANESVETVEKLISEATSDLDKCVVKGILHKNTVARRKARLSRAKKALEATLN